MKQIVFVDDEPNVLDGLRRMLRPMRREWQMVFLGTGAEVLGHLENAPCDVIVSDMRMPGMDGVQLLSEVKRKYPRTIRIALSGHTEPQMIYRSIECTHQYLAKPCDADTLTTTVNKASALQRMLSNDGLKTLVSKLSSVPSLPELYQSVMQELRSEDPSLKHIGEIIASDIAMTAKILQLVNSAFFGVSRHVSSPGQATMFLGLDVIRSLVLTTGIFSQLEQDVGELVNLDALWRHSTHVGGLAKQIATQESDDKMLVDFALMAGSLHDIGQVVLACNLPEEYAKVQEISRRQQSPRWEVECEILGHSHMEVGAYLIGLWGLPNPIVEAVAYHHNPHDSVSSQFSALTAVHAADALLQPVDDIDLPSIDAEYITRTGLEHRISAWQELCSEFISASEEEDE